MIAAYAMPGTRSFPWRRVAIALWLVALAGTVSVSAAVRLERDRAARMLANPPRSRVIVVRVPFAVEINAAARRFNLDPSLVAAVAFAESGFNPRAVSPQGARGVMQVMPATFRDALPSSGCPRSDDDPCVYDPRTNLAAGSAHLRALLRRFDGDVVMALAAYNAGGRPVERHRGMPPYPETRHFVERVGMAWAHLHGEGTLTRAAARLVAGFSGWVRVEAWVLGAVAVAGAAIALRRR